MQNEFDNSGIKGIEEQDLGQVEVIPNSQETSAYPQFTDEAKQQRGTEDFKTIKKNFKKALPFIPNLAQEFAPGADLLRQFGLLGDIGGEQTYQPSTAENITGGIEKIKQGDKVGGGVDVAMGGLETLGATADVMMLGAGFAGPLAPVLLGAGVVLKGITKGGRAILQTKKGKTFLGKIKGNDIQSTPKADGDGFEKTVEVEEILAENPEAVQELGNTDNLPITFTDTSSDLELTKDKRREPQRSRLNDTIDTLQNKATGEQYLKTLQNKAEKGDFSMEELEHSKLDEYLKLQQNNEKPIPKSVIENYMSTQTPQLIVEKRTSEGGTTSGGDYDNTGFVDFEDSYDRDYNLQSAEEQIRLYDDANFINDGLTAALRQRETGQFGEKDAKENFFENYSDITGEFNEKDLEDTFTRFEKLIEEIPTYAEASAQRDFLNPDGLPQATNKTSTEYFNEQIVNLRRKLEKPSAYIDSRRNVKQTYFNKPETYDKVIEGEARRYYSDNPEIRYIDNDTGYEMTGNITQGYRVINEEGDEVFPRAGGTIFDSFEEARVVSVENAIERGLITDQGTLYGDFTTGLGNKETYEELPYYIDSKKTRDAKSQGEDPFYGRDYGNNHYKQENNVGHLRTILIPSTEPHAKNRSIFLVEEFQTDSGNLARQQGGYKPTQKQIKEVQNILGESKLNAPAFNQYTEIVDKDGQAYLYDDGKMDIDDLPVNSQLGTSVREPGFYGRQSDGLQTITVKHPKSDEIMKYLKKKNLNIRGRVSSDMPLKNKTHEFNFREALSEAVNKDQTHMFYVAGESHALRYNEAYRLDSFDRVPDSILKEEYKKFTSRPVLQSFSNRDVITDMSASNNDGMGITFVAGKDGDAIPLPFDLDNQPLKFQGKIEAYAQDKTQDNFFDDLMMVDMNFASDYYGSEEARYSTLKVHLLVDKKTDDVLGVFFPKRANSDGSYRRTQPQDREDKIGAHSVNMEQNFFSNKKGIELREGNKLIDITPSNLKEDNLLSEDEIKDLKRKDKLDSEDSTSNTESDYFDEFTDVETQGRVLGGKGKKDLYNKIIKKYGDKYLKKIDPDAKIFFELMKAENGDFVPTYGFEITPKIRKKILEDGIENFNEGGAVVVVRTHKKNNKQKKYKPQIIRKSYGTFVDKDNNNWGYIDG